MRHPFATWPWTAVLLALGLSSASTQERVLELGWNAVYDYRDKELTSLWTGAPYQWDLADMVRDSTDQGYYLLSFNRYSSLVAVVRYDGQGRLLQRTPIDVGAGREPLTIRPTHSGGLLVFTDFRGEAQLHERSAGGWHAVTTLFQGVGGCEGMAQNLLDGDYLTFRSSLMSYDPARGVVRTLVAGTYGLLYRLSSQDIETGDIYFQAFRWSGSVRVPAGFFPFRPAGILTTLAVKGMDGFSIVAARNDPNTIDGTLYLNATVGGVTRVVRWDPRTNAFLWTSRGPASARFLVSHRPRGLGSEWLVAHTNAFKLHVNFPGHGGKAYAVAVSVSGTHPGLRLTGRVLHLNPDRITLAGLLGFLDPVLAGWAGRLDANGRALAKLDLRPLGHAVFGQRVWAVAAALDAAAPDGIASLSAPVVIVCDSQGP